MLHTVCLLLFVTNIKGLSFIHRTLQLVFCKILLTLASRIVSLALKKTAFEN